MPPIAAPNPALARGCPGDSGERGQGNFSDAICVPFSGGQEALQVARLMETWSQILNWSSNASEATARPGRS